VKVDSHVNGQLGQSHNTTPDPDDVRSRSEGRPPEEQSSEDPTRQAKAILQDSQDRVSEVGETGEDT
jgi:hypothetical protein